MDIFSVLEKLCTSYGVSGEENMTSHIALEMLKEYTADCYIDDFNSVIGFIGDRNNGKKTLLLDAHIDEIGMIVSYIDDDGFIKVGSCGGVDKRILPAQTVSVHGKRDIRGIISTLPPHVAEDSKKAIEMDKVAIDTGYTKAQLEEIVSLGDKVTVDSQFTKMINGRVTGKSIDDRSGVAAILFALDLLKGKTTAYNIAISFSSQEELGSRGTKIASYNIQPDVAFAVDVSFAKTPDISASKCGILGDGVMIGIAPTLNKNLSNELISIAKREKIAYQIEVMNGATGTNADDIAESRSGAAAVTLSIPQRYMHTPVEVVEIGDIEAVGKLIAAYAEVK